jgi:hypothetical protein
MILLFDFLMTAVGARPSASSVSQLEVILTHEFPSFRFSFLQFSMTLLAFLAVFLMVLAAMVSVFLLAELAS